MLRPRTNHPAKRPLTTRLTLLDSSKLRYVTGAMMYFAQGIPRGLLSIAIPAWVASQDVSAGVISGPSGVSRFCCAAAPRAAENRPPAFYDAH